MDDNDFYEEDESIEERRAAWKRGDPGTTTGPRDLNPQVKAIVDGVAERWDEPKGDDTAKKIVFLDANTWFLAAKIEDYEELTAEESRRIPADA